MGLNINNNWFSFAMGIGTRHVYDQNWSYGVLMLRATIDQECRQRSGFLHHSSSKLDGDMHSCDFVSFLVIVVIPKNINIPFEIALNP
jgi:hypothetical protein